MPNVCGPDFVGEPASHRTYYVACDYENVVSDAVWMSVVVSGCLSSAH